MGYYQFLQPPHSLWPEVPSAMVRRSTGLVQVPARGSIAASGAASAAILRIRAPVALARQSFDRRA